MPPPGRRGRGRGAGGATFRLHISRRHFKAPNWRRGRARNSRRSRSGSAPSEGRPQSPPCQDHVAEQRPVSCSSKLLGTLKESSTTTTSSSTPQALLHDIDTTEISASSGLCLSSSPGPNILVRKPPDWYLKFYIRIDRLGSFHTYPDVGGPFKSLQEAENAIDCHLRGLQHETMSKESLGKLSRMDWLVRQALYWPDGKRRNCSEEFASENTCTVTNPLFQVLVDKYNDDNNLSGDRAHELKDALHYQTMRECEENIWYYHFNFTTKTKEAGDIDNLFFAEVTLIEGDELAVNCFCMINTDANGRCYGCTNNGSVDMKHPNEANAYKAGDPDYYLQFGHSGEWDSSDDEVEDFKDEEDRIRHIYKGLDDPDILKKIYAPSPYATATFY